MPWQQTLRTVLEAVYDSVEREGITWAVVGSTATALQGCRVTPHDVDIGTRDPRAVFRFAELLAPFAAAESTSAAPVWVGRWGGFDFHLGRWTVAGVRVEVGHRVPVGGWPGPAGDECRPGLWLRVRRVPFAGYSVPVVPLEMQAEVNLVRGRTRTGEDCMERVKEIARVFREKGYDRAVLEWALSREQLARFDAIMQGG